MKKFLMTLFAVSVTQILFATNPGLSGATGILSAPPNSNSSTTINTLDTVVFDLSQAVYVGPYVEIPVSINSNDTVYALDFAMKYDHSRLAYDSLINLNADIQSTIFYNTSDSTLRFSSYSLLKYDNGVSLVLLRFYLFATQLNMADLNSLTALLNGDPCSVKVTNAAINGIPQISDFAKTISVYPNPADNHLTIESRESIFVELLNETGDMIVAEQKSGADGILDLNTLSLPAGIYYLKIRDRLNSTTRKVIISR